MPRRKPKPDYIDGIFNYCDRWCERCPFTERCRNFTMGRIIQRRLARQDEVNNQFWQAMDKTLGDALAEVAKQAESLPPPPPPPPPDPVEQRESEEFARGMKEDDRWVRRHTLGKHADVYLRAAGRWLKSNEPEKGSPTYDATEIIAWYHMFIYVKLCRALSGLRDQQKEDYDELVDDDGVPFPRDSDGSAKIAIIAIERSITAWSALREIDPKQAKTALKMMTQLARLRTMVDQTFPDARDFKRPGFDDPRETAGLQ